MEVVDVDSITTESGRGRAVMLLDIISGTHPAMVRAGAWLDAHPRVALAGFLALMVLASARWE